MTALATVAIPNPNPFLLGDDVTASLSGTSFPQGAGGLIQPGFLPDLTLATQRDELINSPYASEIPRLNAQFTYTFKVSRNLNTRDNTLAFLADHPALVPQVGTLIITIGNTTRSLVNAVLKRCYATEHTGLSFVFNYSFSGSYTPPVLGAAGTGTGGPFVTNQQL